MTVSLTEKKIEDFSKLAHARVWSRRDARLEKMERLYLRINPGTRSGIVLCFALAKIYDDLNEVDKAFNLLREGNRHHRRGKGDTIADAVKTIGAVIDIFSNQDIKSLEDPSPYQPIFVMGLPRSGTSLVEQILDTHSRVSGGGELIFMGQWCVRFLNRYFRDPSGPELNDHLGGLRDFYSQGLERLGLGGYVTDKMPQNFLWTGFILSAFPAARIVHTVREPMAVCWSLYKTDFAGVSHGYSCDLNDIGEFHRLYTGLMEFWHQRFPGRIYDLNYERLTEDQERQTRKLLEYCGLEWEAGCLEFHRNPRQVGTASGHQVKLPMYQGSSESWKRYDRYLEPLKQALDCS